MFYTGILYCHHDNVSLGLEIKTRQNQYTTFCIFTLFCGLQEGLGVRVTVPNTYVPMMQIYLDPSKDLTFDYRLSRASINALFALLRREKNHGQAQNMEVLLFCLLVGTWTVLQCCLLGLCAKVNRI